jgi:hypothetical protein
MLVPIALTLALIMVAAAVHSELRSASCGIALSNGVEVLVSPEMYREIVHQYRTMDEPDDLKRWDQAVLDALRPERPNEWKYLVRTLGYQVATEGHATRRRRQPAAGRVVGRGMTPRT